jgi:hypothetical protein
LALCTAACGQEGEAPAPAEAPSEPIPPGSPGARWELLEMLRADVEREQNPADGGGRAWLEWAEDQARFATARAPGRFTIVYEVGPQGIATGGVIYLQVSPFWGWSTPQVEVPDAPGYTEIETSDDSMELAAATLDQQLLGLEVTGRALVQGERIRMTFGAGDLGARADDFAEKNSRFWISVDGDGDGTRTFLEDSPGVDVHSDGPARLVLTGPSIARPGEPFHITAAVLDAYGNAGPHVVGQVVFTTTDEGLDLPEPIVLAPGDGGRKTVSVTARREGVLRLAVRGPGDLEAESNPILVTAAGPRVLWGDLHGHSAISDGTGTPEDYFIYARDVAALDVVALTDHDHWGILPLSRTPAFWEDIQAQTKRFHEPGRFVTLLGFEWTSWVHGHRHVLYFADQGEVLSSVDPDYESPAQLWKALEGKQALTFAHHSAGGPIATNWDFAPDPRFEPVTEIVSVHGSSEALDSPGVIYSPVAGNFVRDALDRGYRLGFLGSGDSHDGHPGLPQLNAASGGLAAILSEERTREGVLAALRARRVYATNGPRILLRAALGTHGMGASVSVPAGESLDEDLFIQAIAPAPIAVVDVIRSGEVIESMSIEDLPVEIALQLGLEDLTAGEYVYVRVVQIDGGAAWSSPIFFETE